MSPRPRAGLLLLAVPLALATACAHRAPGPPRSPAPAPGAAPVTRGLAADAVLADALVTRVVYAWLDEGAAAAWAREGGLPVAPAPLAAIPTRLAERAASHRIRAGSRLSGLLATRAAARRLAVWPNPWGAALGWRGERLGRVLARITLRGEAIVGIFEAERAPAWSFVTPDGLAVAPARVLAEPHRLAAVFHIDASDASHAYDPDVYRMRQREGLPVYGHRELVLIAPDMVASVEVGGPAVAGDLAASVAGLVALRRQRLSDGLALDPWRQWRVAVAEAMWATAAPNPSPLSYYEAGLARPTPAYYPSPERLAALIAALGEGGAGP